AQRQIAIISDRRPGFAAGACGRIEWGAQTIGFIGKIDRAIASRLSLREIPAAAEIELAPLLQNAQHVPQLKPLPRFPAVRRDVSLGVAENMRYQQIEQLIRRLQPPNLEELEYVTTYRGKPLENGTKSISITLIFRSPTATLSGDQVESAVQRVVDAA